MLRFIVFQNYRYRDWTARGMDGMWHLLTLIFCAAPMPARPAATRKRFDFIAITSKSQPFNKYVQVGGRDTCKQRSISRF